MANEPKNPEEPRGASLNKKETGRGGRFFWSSGRATQRRRIFWVDIETTGLGEQVVEFGPNRWKHLVEQLGKQPTLSKQLDFFKTLNEYKYFEEVGLAQLVSHSRHGPKAFPGHARYGYAHGAGYTVWKQDAASLIKARDIQLSEFAQRRGIVKRSIEAFTLGKAKFESRRLSEFSKLIQDVTKWGRMDIRGWNVWFDVFALQSFMVRHAGELDAAGIDPFTMVNKWKKGLLNVESMEEHYFDLMRWKAWRDPEWGRQHLRYGKMFAATVGAQPGAPIPILEDIARKATGQPSHLRGRYGWKAEILESIFNRFGAISTSVAKTPLPDNLLWPQLHAHDALRDIPIEMELSRRFRVASKTVQRYDAKWGQLSKLIPGFKRDDLLAFGFARAGFLGPEFTSRGMRGQAWTQRLVGDTGHFNEMMARYAQIMGDIEKLHAPEYRPGGPHRIIQSPYGSYKRLYWSRTLRSIGRGADGAELVRLVEDSAHNINIFRKQAAQGARGGFAKLRGNRLALIGGAAFGGWAIYNAFGRKQRTIEANLPHEYIPGQQGQKIIPTPFGSPYMGPSIDQDSALETMAEGALFGTAGWGFYNLPRWLGPSNKVKAYYWARFFEDITPFRVGRIFNVSAFWGSYMPTSLGARESYSIASEVLRSGNELTPIGKTYARALGMQGGDLLSVLNTKQFEGGLTFNRVKGPWMGIDFGGKLGRRDVRFFEAYSRLGHTFSVLNAEAIDAVPDLLRGATLESRLQRLVFNTPGPEATLFQRGNRRLLRWLYGKSSIARKAIRRYASIPLWESDQFRMLQRNRLAGTDVMVPAYQRGVAGAGRMVHGVFMDFMMSGYNTLRRFTAPFGMRLPAARTAPKMIGGFAKAGAITFGAITAFNIANDMLGGMITAPFQNLYERISLARAEASDVTGLTSLRQTYPEIQGTAPLAIGITAGATYLGLKWGIRTKLLAEQRRRGIAEDIPGTRIWRIGEGGPAQYGIREESYREAPEIARGMIKRWFGRPDAPPGTGFLGKLNVRGKLVLGGLAAATALTMPFMLGSEYTAGELEEVYSGERLVPIRRGRWWEFGCVKADTPIMTYNGRFIEAKSVKHGDHLINANGHLEPCVQIWKRSFCGQLYSFTTYADRYTKTSLTGNHRIPIIRFNNSRAYTIKRGIKIQEIPADQIRIHDYVEIPIPQSTRQNMNCGHMEMDLARYVDPCIIENNKIYPSQKNKNGKPQKCGKWALPRSLIIDENISRLFGYFLAEGNISFRNSTEPQFIETVHALTELSIVNDIIKICQQYFNITPIIRQRKSEQCYIVRICSSLLARFFFALFYNNDRSSDKVWPDELLNVNPSAEQQLIHGLWLGDGHTKGHRRVITTCRYDFAQAVRVILLRGGFAPTLRFEDNNGRGCYRIAWNTENKTPEGFLRYNGRLFAQIVSIVTEEYDGDVYDFGLDNDPHLFTAGVFLIHNSTPYEGGRIHYWRMHQLARRKYRALEEVPGSERGLMPAIRSVFNPYWREEASYYDRPYPVTAAPFEEVPLVGPLLAGTVGRWLKPPRLMHTETWQAGMPYEQYGPEFAPGPGMGGLPSPTPLDPYGLAAQVREATYRITEFAGLRGFITQSALFGSLFGGDMPAEQAAVLQPARLGPSITEKFWEAEVGGMMGMNEVFRRLFPRPERGLEVNPLANRMPRWIPGQDYFVNFRIGDPYSKVPYGEERLPGPGYERLHPEVAGLRYEDYPAFHKYKILADVAPWSKQARIFRSVAYREAGADMTRLEALDRIDRQVDAVKRRRDFKEYSFLAERDTIRGTIARVGPGGEFTLAEYPRHTFTFAGLSMGLSASADQLRRINNLTKEEATRRAYELKETRQQELNELLTGRSVTLGIARGGLMAPSVEATVTAGLTNINAMLAERGYGLAEGGYPTAGFVGRMYGGMLERLGHLPQMVPGPWMGFTKFFNQADAMEDYRRNELYGAQMRFWDKPIENFIRPYMYQTIAKLTPGEFVPRHVEKRREYDMLFDRIKFLKYYQQGDTRRAIRTMAGANVYSSELMLEQALPYREKPYFQAFVQETDPNARKRILSMVSADMQRALVGQWTKQYAQVTGGDVPRSNTQARIQAAAQMAVSQVRGAGYNVPGPEWVGWDKRVDFEDVKAVTIEHEGIDRHEFNIWDDRTNSLMRKPYLFGAAEALTSRRMPTEIVSMSRHLDRRRQSQHFPVETINHEHQIQFTMHNHVNYNEWERDNYENYRDSIFGT